MFKNIVVPVDLSDLAFAKKAIDVGVSMARASDGTLRLVTVMPLTPVMLAEYVPPDFDEQQRSSTEDQIAQVARDTGLPPHKVSTSVRQGGIYHEIIEAAKEFGCDLIVMSSHRPAMRTYFLGSNAGHVVRYATCSVLVVRE